MRKTQIEYKFGDCLDLMPAIPDCSIDLVLTDPPFGVRYDYGESSFEDYSSPEEYFAWCSRWFREVYRVVKHTGSFICFFSPKYVRQMLDLGMEVGLHYQDLMIWDKICAKTFNGPRRPMPLYEPCAWWTKGDKWTYNPPCSNVLRFPRLTSATGVNHRAERPRGLYVQLVRVFSNEGDLVLDPFVGSGTTLLACRITGRRGIGFEIDPMYAEVIRSKTMESVPKIEDWSYDGVITGRQKHDVEGDGK